VEETKQEERQHYGSFEEAEGRPPADDVRKRESHGSDDADDADDDVNRAEQELAGKLGGFGSGRSA
jgi:hypothetical protein